MKKAVSVCLSLVFLFSVALATCPFSARFDVSWDSIGMGWNVNETLFPMLRVAGSRTGLFNITSGTSSFYISSKDCSFGPDFALTRADGVTNNVCTPPCTVAYNLNVGYYFYCSSLASVKNSGTLHVLQCQNAPNFRCSQVIGCGWDEDQGKCGVCFDQKSSSDCKKLTGCSWCSTDDVCLDEDSGACREPINGERAVASWVWLLITVCALVVLVAVMLTLFLMERGFQKRWATIAKTDKDFAEVGKGANDGLFATD